MGWDRTHVWVHLPIYCPLSCTNSFYSVISLCFKKIAFFFPWWTSRWVSEWNWFTKKANEWQNCHKWNHRLMWPKQERNSTFQQGKLLAKLILFVWASPAFSAGQTGLLEAHKTTWAPWQCPCNTLFFHPNYCHMYCYLTILTWQTHTQKKNQNPNLFSFLLLPSNAKGVTGSKIS